MFDFPSIKPIFLQEQSESQPLTRAEQIVYWTIVLTPVWWLLGIQPLFYPVLIAGLFLYYFDIDRIVRVPLPLCAWAWLLMSLVMLWTATLGLLEIGANTQSIMAAGVNFLKSYFLIFACLTLPFWSQIRTQVVTRAIAWMSAGYLVTIAAELVLLLVSPSVTGYNSPLARLVPGDKSSLRIIFASHSSFLGLPIPRTVLYTPDPPILGLIAVLCFLICLGEYNGRLRQFALTGCVAALILSQSRSAILAFPLALLVGACLQSGVFRQISLWLTSFTFLGCAIVGTTIGDLMQRGSEQFEQVRADSSEARAIVVQKTLEAWQQSPWLGWGVIRGRALLYEDVYISLGSFSTYAAVLYLHGIVGFVALIAAMVLTLAAVYTPALQGHGAAKWAFSCLLVLYVLSNATPLSWMAVYLWFFFIWLGAVIRETRSPQLIHPDWA